MFQIETQGTIARGESISLGKYEVVFQSLDVFDAPDGRNVARAVLDVKKDGEKIGELYPRRDYYYDTQQPVTIPGVRASLVDDLYVILADWQPITTQEATFKVYQNPLVTWLWVGSLVFIFGTIIAAWPARRRRAV